MCYSISVGNRKFKQPSVQACIQGCVISAMSSHIDWHSGKHWGIEIRDRWRGGCGDVFSPENLAHFAGRFTIELEALLDTCTHSCQGVAAPRCAAAAGVGSLKERYAEVGVAGRLEAMTLRSVCLDLIGEIIAAVIPVDVANDALLRQCLPFMSDQQH